MNEIKKNKNYLDDNKMVDEEIKYTYNKFRELLYKIPQNKRGKQVYKNGKPTTAFLRDVKAGYVLSFPLDFDYVLNEETGRFIKSSKIFDKRAKGKVLKKKYKQYEAKKGVIRRKKTYQVQIVFEPYKMGKAGKFVLNAKPKSESFVVKGDIKQFYKKKIMKETSEYLDLVKNKELYENQPDEIQQIVNENLSNGYNEIWDIISVDITEATNGKELKDSPMFNATMNIDISQFNKFKDSGQMKCVPEVLYTHLTTKCKMSRKKNSEVELANKMSLKRPSANIILQENVNPMLDESDTLYEGFSPLQISSLLNDLGVPYKLMDINQNIFLSNNVRRNNDMSPFVAICYSNHLYYCDDKEHIKSLGQVRGNSNFHKKETKKETSLLTKYYDQSDLLEEWTNECIKNNTIITKCTLYNGRLTAYTFEGKKHMAIENHELVKKITEASGNKFYDSNIVSATKALFNSRYNIKKSTFFTYEYDMYCNNKVKALVHTFKNAKGSELNAVDINKCRTDCLKNNKLGDYLVYDINDKIINYSGNIQCGSSYFVSEIKHDILYLSANAWFDYQMLLELDKRNIEYTITHEYKASHSIPANYFSKFVDDLIEIGDFKFPVNAFIGDLGQTISKYQTGYIEGSKDVAVHKFINKPDFFNLAPVQLGDKTVFGVSKKTSEVKYSNSLPIYNKVLQNELLKILQICEDVGLDNVVSIKTDCVIYQPCSFVPKLSTYIGGLKTEDKTLSNFRKVKKDIKPTLLQKYNFSDWCKIDSIENNSCLITGYAGFGKSHLIKSTNVFNQETTLKLSWSNVASLNIDGFTMCNKLGIDWKEQTFKRVNMDNVKCIIVDEIFMTPSYCLSALVKIKQDYPNIQFICLGDPHQNRPVGEEHIDMYNGNVLKYLCNSNEYTLTTNYRNDCTKEYMDILNDSFDTTLFKAKGDLPLINIVKYNNTRKSINDIIMKREGTDKTVRILKNDLYKNDKGQDVYLYKGLKVMCVVNDKKLDIFNSQQGIVEYITDTNINIKMENGIHIDFDDKTFMKFFVVCYAYTNHKVQGLTILEKFRIHDWDNMTSREKYTAFSRCINRNSVDIGIK
jgi:hypothetical protein